jgi:hypothetical protein
MYKAIRFHFPASYTFSATEHVNTEKHIENLPLREEKKGRAQKMESHPQQNWNFRFQVSKINEVVMSGDEQREGDV